MSLTQSDYIRYLYQEGVRKGAHKTPNFYSELIQFVKSPEGQEGFYKFAQLQPQKIGLYKPEKVCHLFKKAF